MTKQRISMVNLYNEEDGIAVYVTPELDICERGDDDAAIKIIGHRLYACSLEEAQRSIVRRYKRWVAEVGAGAAR